MSHARQWATTSVRPQVAARIEGGRTALFAFCGTFQTSDWGTNTEARLAVLGTAEDLFPCEAIDSGASVHAGFLARFRETLGAGGLAAQVHASAGMCGFRLTGLTEHV